MTTLIERARQWGRERDQEWLQKGIDQGIEKGVERGRTEGERELVHRLVTPRFGPGNAERLLPMLGQPCDPARIAAIASVNQTFHFVRFWLHRSHTDDRADLR